MKSNYLVATTVGMAMIAARRRRQPSTIRTITQAGLNTTIFDMVGKSKDDLRWFHDFEMVNLFPVFVLNLNFMPKNKKIIS